MYTWLGDLSAKLRKDMEDMRQRQDTVPPGGGRRKEGAQSYTSTSGLREGSLLLYMSLLPVDKLALITILEIMRMSGTGGIADGMKALRGMLAVGKAIETEYRAETIKNVAGVDSPHWLRAIDPQTQKPSRVLVSNVWHSLGKQLKEGKESADEADRQLEHDLRAVWTPAWSQMVQLGLGSYLVESLLSVAKVNRFGKDPVTGEQVTEEQAAFTHGYDYVRGKKLGVIRLNPVVASRLARDNVGVVIHPKHLPMLVEPRPWRSHDEGGYLMHRGK
jgi:DNA-directed RNA polymerase